MKFSNNWRVPALVGALLGGLLLAPHASATVSGTMNNAGGGQTVTVTLSVIDFHPVGGGTGTFTTSGGTNLISPSGNVGSGVMATIKDLAAVNQPPIANFITFSGSGIVFDLSVIGPGSAITNCAGLAIGDSCSIFPGSPFILTKTSVGTGVALSVSGTAHDGTPPDSTWMGGLTTQFVGMSPQDIQNQFGCAGAATAAACTHQNASITSSWSGSFIVTPLPPPHRNVCPLTQGFWKNHPNAWPVTSLQLGSKTYTEAELLVIFTTPPKGDASLILAHQLIAAKLNVANGTSSLPVLSTIAAADALLATFSGKLPYGVPSASVIGQQMVALSATLDSFNSGAFNPGCVD